MKIEPGDRIVSGADELYANVKERGLTHLIYMGVHTNICVIGKPEAMKNMVAAGLNCMLARDLTDAFTLYDPGAGFTPDHGTAQIVGDIERAGIPTINLLSGMRQEDAEVEMVRFSPWGTTPRPYEFEKSLKVTLSTPWLKDVEIRYTTGGARPDSRSARYTAPLILNRSEQFQAAAFRGGRRISRIREAEFVKLPPMPSKPDVYAEQLKPLAYPNSSWIWPVKNGESLHAARAGDGNPHFSPAIRRDESPNS